MIIKSQLISIQHYLAKFIVKPTDSNYCPTCSIKYIILTNLLVFKHFSLFLKMSLFTYEKLVDF